MHERASKHVGLDADHAVQSSCDALVVSACGAGPGLQLNHTVVCDSSPLLMACVWLTSQTFTERCQAHTSAFFRPSPTAQSAAWGVRKVV